MRERIWRAATYGESDVVISRGKRRRVYHNTSRASRLRLGYVCCGLVGEGIGEVIGGPSGWVWIDTGRAA